MQANALTEEDLAAGEVLDSIRDFQAAIDGMRAVMSKHALRMLRIVGEIVQCANYGIPKEYETAISSRKEQIIWFVIKMDIHNVVCDLIAIEGEFFECLSMLRKVSLLDDDCQKEWQDLERVLAQHKLYISSVTAVNTILTKLIPLRTSRARQDKYETCP